MLKKVYKTAWATRSTADGRSAVRMGFCRMGLVSY